jgi:hypothetical protein
MKKHLFLAALAGLLWALPASAGITYTLIKSDTTALNSNERGSRLSEVEGRSDLRRDCRFVSGRQCQWIRPDVA